MGVDNSDGDKFKIGTTALETSTTFTIDGSQRVGIGTSSPGKLLDVVSLTGLSTIRIKGDAGAGSTRAELIVDRTADPRGGGVRIQSSGGSADEWYAAVPYDGGASVTGFSIGSHASQPEYTANSDVFINSDGDVGIGTTSPASGLDVQNSLGLAVSTVTATATLDQTHNVVLCSGGAFTVTLPAASTNTGKVYYIKKTDGGTNYITIDGNSAETIDGAATVVLYVQYDALRIICDGSNWHIIDDERIPHSTKLRSSSAQSIGNASAVQIDCNNEDWDIGGIASTTSDDFVVQRDGRYNVNFHVISATALDDGEVLCLP